MKKILYNHLIFYPTPLIAFKNSTYAEKKKSNIHKIKTLNKYFSYFTAYLKKKILIKYQCLNLLVNLYFLNRANKIKHKNYKEL